jgi:hypothetical protein
LAAGSVNADTVKAIDVQYEYDHVKRVLANENEVFDARNMNDKEISAHVTRTVNFNFMETAEDKKFLKQEMDRKLLEARMKSNLKHHMVGGLKNRLSKLNNTHTSSKGKRGQSEGLNMTFSSNMTGKKSSDSNISARGKKRKLSKLNSMALGAVPSRLTTHARRSSTLIG